MSETAQYVCRSDARRAAVRAAVGADGKPLLNGIDYLEVASGNQTILRVHFIHPLPGEAGAVPPAPFPPLERDNILIEGGGRIRGIEVTEVRSAANVLTVRVNAAGDFSTYTLRLVQSTGNLLLLAGFDPRLAHIGFSFKTGCPSPFDCRTQPVQPLQSVAQPEISYLAKDYASFRQLMLDRLSTVMPGWRERSPADMQTALIELLAYVGDTLSYYQDAVATEAYLGTARKRISVRRHARLLDYFMHEGSNARAWVCFEVEPESSADGATLPPGAQLLTRGSSDAAIVLPENAASVLQLERPVVFETQHTLTLRASHNRIRFYTWSEQECCLPEGSTQATLRDALDSTGRRVLALKKGNVLIFEQTLSPATGLPADADPALRCAVRLTRAQPGNDPLTGQPVLEIEWDEADALPFSLCLSAVVASIDGKPSLIETATIRGNVVLADHGVTLTDESLPAVPETGVYRPRLRTAGLTFQVPLDLAAPAAVAMRYDAHDALPSIAIKGDGGTWTPQYDLLTSDPFRREFVVEMQSDGIAQLRFGDGVSGRRPSSGARFTATYRHGNGASGNVGAEALGRVIWKGSGIRRVRNPMAATGGADPESLEQVRQFAPRAFRKQERAVTAADYADITERSSDVQQAACTLRWTGSWHTAFVTVDRKGGAAVDGSFRESIRQYLERYRMAGVDVEVNGPTFVPLDLALEIDVEPEYFRSDVESALRDAFSNRDLPNGVRGFFHPDQLTFGQPVYLSQLYRAAMRVAGVAAVNVTRLQRWGALPNGELESGVLSTGSLEIVQLANDPNFPENGRLDLLMRGGL